LNYRHAFHAGNFADVFKHALLLEILATLARKPAAFAVLDTHAGIGGYDLAGAEAARTGEWQAGVGRVAGLREGPLARYAGAVREAGFPPRYPGSPLLAARALRQGDRLLLCELHEADHATLAARLRGDPRIAVHRRDGYEALRALTPFAERRGLVLIDPPFEQEGEFARITDAITLLHHRFRAGIVAAWYPIKHRAPVRDFGDALRASGVRDILDAALWLREPTEPSRLNGCGLVVVNAPWGFAESAQAIGAALVQALASEPGAGHAVTRLADE
jgi:23S rRNA (adenine2030-N6)-methyltransferase